MSRCCWFLLFVPRLIHADGIVLGRVCTPRWIHHETFMIEVSFDAYGDDHARASSGDSNCQSAEASLELILTVALNFYGGVAAVRHS